MQSTATFGKDLIKFISSLNDLEALQKPETPQELIVGADMTRKILLKALELDSWILSTKSLIHRPTQRHLKLRAIRRREWL